MIAVKQASVDNKVNIVYVTQNTDKCQDRLHFIPIIDGSSVM